MHVSFTGSEFQYLSYLPFLLQIIFFKNGVSQVSCSQPTLPNLFKLSLVEQDGTMKKQHWPYLSEFYHCAYIYVLVITLL